MKIDMKAFFDMLQAGYLNYKDTIKDYKFTIDEIKMIVDVTYNLLFEAENYDEYADHTEIESIIFNSKYSPGELEEIVMTFSKVLEENLNHLELNYFVYIKDIEYYGEGSRHAIYKTKQKGILGINYNKQILVMEPRPDEEIYPTNKRNLFEFVINIAIPEKDQSDNFKLWMKLRT